MSTIAVSYNSLKDASSEAKGVATKLGKYADSIESTVYKKLNKYNGEWTSSLTSAQSYADTKITNLRDKAESYKTYSDDLIDLKDECVSVDRAVKSQISKLSAKFKETHNIRDSKIENAITALLIDLENSSFVGRWLGETFDTYNTAKSYLKESIKNWYHYEGGKEAIQGILVGVLEVAIGILSIAAAILSGGALLVIIAGVIAGVIAVANGIANIVNEKRAFDAAQRNDPATARRLSSENTIQDFLKDGDITDEKNEGWVNNHVTVSRNIATGIDVVNTACTIITVVSSVGKLLKNGYKWATGVASDTKNIQWRQIFSEGKGREIFSGLKDNFGNGFKEIGAALKRHDFTFFKAGIVNFGSDFLANLKGEFMDFGSLKGGISSTKNILGVVKNIVGGEVTWENFAKDIVLPGITVFKVDKLSYYDNGTSYIDLDSVKLDSIYNIYSKTDSKIIPVITELASPSDINISIPEIYVPDITITEFSF